MHDRYFLALVPPSPLFEECIALKEYVHSQYKSKAALRSPPHITLHMPFLWKTQNEDSLLADLQRMSQTLDVVDIEMNGFGCFAPKVIYIQITPSQPLLDLQRKVRKFCREELNLLNADYKEKPFHPHMTIAFRDLKKKVFPEAWTEFQNKSFEGRFTASQLSLLKHDGKRWNIFRTFLLSQG